jgi:AAA domain
MNFEIIDAQDAPVLVRAFVAGFSETGKTLTALHMAQALGGNCVVIDSDQHSVRRYSKSFPNWKFKILPLSNYSVESYTGAINHCISKKFDVIVIDSLSQLWDSKGGLAEQAEENAANNAKTTQLGWNKAKNQAKRAILDFTKANAHLIYTFRSAGEYEREAGKFKIVGERLSFAKGVEYEFNVKCWMNSEHTANISVRGMDHPMDFPKPSVEDFRKMFEHFQQGTDADVFNEMKLLIQTSSDMDSVKAQLSANKHWLNAEQIKELGTLLKAKTLK